MIQSVLDDAGYDVSTAALLVTEQFLAGEASRSGLAAKLEGQLGKAAEHRRPCTFSLPRYAIELQSRNLAQQKRPG
ncbi:hypothetical protein [Ensifer sp. LCM 4579]|uniref:hypothetical protein n=1 Tax=Ensifer sp. LCM 4579 TaxID=1848292 RepID=UPI0008DA2E67|nr:hypothetical protein [Ensifer sp. LCM 4579]OHV73321.1 hypothetical protein LCM4579_10365 [Ensifer sp. LCM 4579]